MKFRLNSKVSATPDTGSFLIDWANAFFELTGEDTNVSGAEGKEMAGRPIIGIWKLGARKPGDSIVRMKYYRAWEKSEKAINQFELTVDISP